MERHEGGKRVVSSARNILASRRVGGVSSAGQREYNIGMSERTLVVVTDLPTLEVWTSVCR